MDIFRLDKVTEFCTAPLTKEDFSDWVSQSNVLDFLICDLNDENIILHASVNTMLLNTILVPKEILSASDRRELISWNHDNQSGWSIWSGGGQSKSWIEPPLSGSEPKVLSEGEQLLFKRSFHGVKNREGYIEISEKFLQVMDLHYMHELNAWCKLDENGDIDEIIKIHSLEKNGKELGTVVTIRFGILAEYCDLVDSVVVRLFDVDRIDYANFTQWGSEPEEIIDERGVIGKLKVMPNHASYFRGAQAFFPKHSVESQKKDYASFIAQDWKNRITKEISCSPDSIDNYFTQSDKPFEMSPAFFNAEVLLKYKSDSDKYTLEERSISSRAGWYLKTYDVNDAGQVHTYLGYLQDLPYSEQLHWKQFNEHPKSPISERAKTNDFDGNFYDGNYPVEDLKRELDSLSQQEVTWWKMKSRDLKDSLHPVVTKSVDEWKEEILKLDQILVEGLVKKQLKARAKELNQTPLDKDRELKLLERCLIGCGFDEEHAYEILTPLHDAHNLRSTLKGHVQGKTAEKIRSDAIKDFGSLKEHFNDLCERCCQSISVIYRALEGKDS